MSSVRKVYEFDLVIERAVAVAVAVAFVHDQQAGAVYSPLVCLDDIL